MDIWLVSNLRHSRGLLNLALCLRICTSEQRTLDKMVSICPTGNTRDKRQSATIRLKDTRLAATDRTLVVGRSPRMIYGCFFCFAIFGQEPSCCPVEIIFLSYFTCFLRASKIMGAIIIAIAEVLKDLIYLSSFMTLFSALSVCAAFAALKS